MAGQAVSADVSESRKSAIFQVKQTENELFFQIYILM